MLSAVEDYSCSASYIAWLLDLHRLVVDPNVFASVRSTSYVATVHQVFPFKICYEYMYVSVARPRTYLKFLLPLSIACDVAVCQSLSVGCCHRGYC